MAAKARCVHLIFSKDQKLGRKGGARPHLQQHHPVPQGPPFSIRCWLATGSPQAISQKPHSFHKAKMHTIPSRLFHHTTHTRAHLISCVGGATPPPHNYTHFTPSLPFLRPYSPYNHTGVVCLINCRGLTFDLLSRPPRHLAGVRGHTGRGTRPPAVTVVSPTSEAWARKCHAQPEPIKPALKHAHTLHA